MNKYRWRYVGSDVVLTHQEARLLFSRVTTPDTATFADGAQVTGHLTKEPFEFSFVDPFDRSKRQTLRREPMAAAV